jgi:hypothetical protein
MSSEPQPIATPQMGDVVHPGHFTPEPGLTPPAFAGAEADMASPGPEHIAAQEIPTEEVGSLALKGSADLSTNPAASEPKPSLPSLKAPFEIRRSEGRTVLVNVTHPDGELAERAAADLSNGIPDSWPTYDDGTGSVRYRVDRAEDEGDGPTVFLKIRGDNATLRDSIDRLSNQVEPEHLQAHINRIRRTMGVSHEMRFVPEVRAALQDEAAQEIARAADFASVQFVEPLASVIDAETGQKATVYPWQPGHSVAVRQEEMWDREDIPKSWTQEITRLEGVCERLKAHMEGRGIKATDLRPGNVIISEEDDGTHIHVIDAESYTRVVPSTQAPSSEQAQTPEIPAQWLPPEAAEQTGASPATILRMRDERLKALTPSTTTEAAHVGGTEAPESPDGGLQARFKDVLPLETDNFKDYVQRTLRTIPANERLAIVVGGQGSETLIGFGSYFVETLGVCAADNRDAATVADDEALGHTVVSGGVMDDMAKYHVEDWLGEQKAALIIDDIGEVSSGIEEFPNDSIASARQVAYWYDKLADNGLWLTRVPSALARHIEPWRDYIEANYPDLDIQLGNLPDSEVVTIRMHKRPGSPERLPLLPAKYILWREAQRTQP